MRERLDTLGFTMTVARREIEVAYSEADGEDVDSFYEWIENFHAATTDEDARVHWLQLVKDWQSLVNTSRALRIH